MKKLIIILCIVTGLGACTTTPLKEEQKYYFLTDAKEKFEVHELSKRMIGRNVDELVQAIKGTPVRENYHSIVFRIIDERSKDVPQATIIPFLTTSKRETQFSIQEIVYRVKDKKIESYAIFATTVLF